MLNSPLTDHRG